LSFGARPTSAAGGPSVGGVLEVRVEKIVFGGDGLARCEGLVLFIPFAAEGDRVRVRLVEKKRQHGRAQIVELLASGRGREAAPCPYYGRCGGCQYQHLTYEEECRLKEEQVREAFRRVGKFESAPILPIIPSPHPYHYRNRITVHAEPERLGFRSVGGRELVDIRECLIAREAVNRELTALRARRPAPGHYSLRDATVPPSGFFQANHDLQETLRALVSDSLPARGPALLEGYCGGGFFTEKIAARFDQVIAVDNDPRTLRDALRLGLPNVAWETGDAAFVLPEFLRAWSGRPVAVLVDPPREGLPVRVTEALGLNPAAALTYVSCDPATLARDARLLAPAYELVSVQPIDLFPRTAQIECVGRWRPRGETQEGLKLVNSSPIETDFVL
jgi:23S rRNA (uracil1939-C5)-methyltransferase